MLSRACLLILILVSTAQSQGYYPSSMNQYSNQGSLSNFGYGASSTSTCCGGVASQPSSYMPQSYVPTQTPGSVSSQFGNYGISTAISNNAPVYVPAPISGSPSSSSSYSSNSYSYGASVPSSYTVATQSPTATSNTISSSSTSFSSSSSSLGSSSYVTSGSVIGGSPYSRSYTPSTTIGQISGISSGTPVGSSTTQSQVQSSQNQLVAALPSSPNAINYQVTTVAQQPPPIYFPTTVKS